MQITEGLIMINFVFIIILAVSDSQMRCLWKYLSLDCMIKSPDLYNYSSNISRKLSRVNIIYLPDGYM